MLPIEEMRAKAQGATALQIAFIGVVNHLFSLLHELGEASPQELAQRAQLDAGYVERWCDAAYAFAWLERTADRFRLSEEGDAMRPEHPESRMALAIGTVLGAHMAERAAVLMRTGERPGEKVLAERESILPWFGPMLEQTFRPIFTQMVLGHLPILAEVDQRGGLVVDLGCGNGWYLRALLHHYSQLRGLGLDGFEENIRQATELAAREDLSSRVQFAKGDIHHFQLGEMADLIAMNRALHHVWEERGELFARLHAELRPGGALLIWEPAWPKDPQVLREAPYRAMAFQNLSEYIQGNHFLRPEEIENALQEAGFRTQVHELRSDVLVEARRPH